MNASLAETLKATGPFLVAGQGAIQGVVEVLISILSRKHPAQIAFDEDEDDDLMEEEHSEDEWTMMASALRATQWSF